MAKAHASITLGSSQRIPPTGLPKITTAGIAMNKADGTTPAATKGNRLRSTAEPDPIILEQWFHHDR